MGEKKLIRYFEAERLSSKAVGIFIKLALSIGLVYYLTQSITNTDLLDDPISMIALPLLGGVFYFLFSMFQFSLKLTQNYIIAIIVFALLVVGFFYLWTWLETLQWDNGSIDVLFMFALFLVPLWDIIRLIRLIWLRLHS